MRPHKDVKLKDVADALGISVVSVSNALRGRSGVSSELRARVWDCAKGIGLDLSAYTDPVTVQGRTGSVRYPDVSGSRAEDISIKEKPPGKREEDAGSVTIGVLVSNRYISVGISFYWEMYQKTAHAASLRDCLTALEIVEDDIETSAPQMVLGRDVDGIIVIGPMREEYLERLFAAAVCPIVFMDQQISDSRYSSVLSGNYYGMYRSTRELVRAGHRKIGFIGELNISRNIIDRYYGYKKCMRESGLQIDHRWLLSDRKGRNEEPGMILPDELPTAFVCSSDFAASVLYDALEQRGLHVPEDISLASYDDYLIGHPLSGHLTSYHVDMEHMAKCALKLVLRERKDPAAAGVIYEVDSEVICRDSIRCVGDEG